MPMGVKQILLLRMCETKGYITIGDVINVYAITSNSKYYGSYDRADKALVKLNILITYGVLKQEGLTTGKRPRKKYVLTELGKSKLQEWEIKHQ